MADVGVRVHGLKEVLEFLNRYPGAIAELQEEILTDLAKRMVAGDTSDTLSIKGNAAQYIPRDTGRLMAVFGAAHGVPDTGKIVDMHRAVKKSPKPFEEDVIWNRDSRTQHTVGTTLYYAKYVQWRTDFVGKYLRTVSPKINERVRARVMAKLRSILRARGLLVRTATVKKIRGA